MMNQEEAQRQISDVQTRYGDMLMQLPNVVGIGIGYKTTSGEMTDQLALVVMVEKKIPLDELEPQQRIPAHIEGVTVDVQETGAFFAQ
ncbi:MAG: hypothetical protein ACOCYT_01040 [Chloroflexota bacterium]